MTTTLARGPLTTTAQLSEDSLLGGRTERIAEWLAYVGLGGRYAAVSGQRWRRWDGRCWRECDPDDVNAAVRRALGKVYDRRMEARPSPTETMLLLRLMDLNWSLGSLVPAIRRVCTVPAERLS